MCVPAVHLERSRYCHCLVPASCYTGMSKSMIVTCITQQQHAAFCEGDKAKTDTPHDVLHFPPLAAAATCGDWVKNGAETDVDCGGGFCAACEVGLNCTVGSDCSTSSCNATTGTCVAGKFMDTALRHVHHGLPLSYWRPALSCEPVCARDSFSCDREYSTMSILKCGMMFRLICDCDLLL